jgi:Nif-specific regulatory protein
MDRAAARSATTTAEPALLACLAAIGRALERDGGPGVLVGELSAALRPIVAHDRLAIDYVIDEGRTFSVFGEHDDDTTHLERVARFPVVESPLAAVFDGDVLCVPDLAADPRFARQRDELQLAGAGSAVFVPLVVGRRVIGALCAASHVPDAFGAFQVDRMRSVGRLIGPFIDTIALLHRERRRRHRVALLAGTMQMIGTTLDLRQILVQLGDEVRRAVEFDTMGVVLFRPGGPEYVLFGTVGEPPVSGVERIPVAEFSYAGELMAGRPVLFDDAANAFDPAFAGDRAMLAAGYGSCLWVPMRFGDEVGGALFFGKHEPHWYDNIDVEIAALVASRLVLAIQHQRLAEEQRRLATVERRARTLEQSLKSARSELHQRYGFDQIIGRSPVLREALTRANQVARTASTVLVTGESGTGKELVARAVHHASPRADGPFVAVNCAALPDTLLESELFGHERGAFTGADRQKPGRFELAAGGTLFLDEVGELPAAVQVKLLRVVQEREYQRLGGTATLKADIRLITATNRDLAAELAAGRFRSDLFYRLSVFNVHLPALRERGDDVLLLADSFIRSLAPKMGKGDVTLSRDACEVLRQHPWPGNIRELQNAIERALITCEGTLITAAHLGLAAPSGRAAPAAAPAAPPPAEATRASLEAIERNAILDALGRAHGNKSRAATLLGLTRFQLYTRLKRHGIEIPRD